MKKYVSKVNDKSVNTAGPKAKEDIIYFLAKEKYEIIDNKIPRNKLLRPILGPLNWSKNIRDIRENSIVIYQYPSFSRVMDRYYIERLSKKNVVKVIMIHDLESLRYYSENEIDRKKELEFINSFDYIIAHNNKMKSWLLENGINKEIIELKIFDYYNSSPMIEETNKKIAFVGNLGKSLFLSKMKISTPMSLYGINPKEYNINMSYKGSFSPDLLGEQINETFGLVWDGETIEECSGVLGNYMRFNNPHKASFYLSMGMPIITWKEAALADFVLEHECGLAIDTLEDIDNILSDLSDSELLKLKNNAQVIGRKIRNGYYIDKAVKLIEKTLRYS